MYTDILHTTHLQWVLGQYHQWNSEQSRDPCIGYTHTLASALPWAWHRRTSTPGKGSPFSVEVALSFLLNVNSSGIGAASCSQMCSGSWQLQREGAGKAGSSSSHAQCHTAPHMQCAINLTREWLPRFACPKTRRRTRYARPDKLWSAHFMNGRTWQFPVAQGKPLIKLRGGVSQRSWTVAPLMDPMLCIMIDDSRPSWDGFRRPGSGKTSLSKGPGSPSSSGRFKFYW